MTIVRTSTMLATRSKLATIAYSMATMTQRTTTSAGSDLAVSLAFFVVMGQR
jgi:hypothetical protein